ncbi:hypothetical protein FRC01_005382 [Tulasnella sp. 417]|nr:hypothetical protein FRC01_005382 [Tulasnella sp. 417]
MSGWWLTLSNITLTTGDTFTGTKTFSSGWASYQIPSNLATPASAAAASTVTVVETVTASSASGNHISTGAFAGVTAVLATLFIGATIAAVYFWVRDMRFRRDHQWTQAISAAPIAYTTEPTTTTQNTEYNPLTPPLELSLANQYPPAYAGLAPSTTEYTITSYSGKQ